MQILVSSFLSTGLEHDLSSAKIIDIDDAPIGEGGFGVVYRARNFDGRLLAVPQVIKLLTKSAPEVMRRGFNTVQQLQKFLALEHQKLFATGDSLLDRFPVLYGVPQLSFEGSLNGEAVLGYSANDLMKAGFEDFLTILDDGNKITQYQLMPMWLKFRIAAQFAEAFDFLTSQGHFIHADIKAAAVFVDCKNARCAIIDFDSGVLIQNPSDQPSTVGTLQPWLAPEIAEQLHSASPRGQFVKVSLLSDMWSVAWGIHYLLFGFDPLFFLSEVSNISMREYGQRYSWPSVDPAFRFFNHRNLHAYQGYSQILSSVLPMELLKQFAFTINKGYGNSASRTTYGQWNTLLKAATQPAIRSFEADRMLVSDHRPVRLSWDVSGATRLEIKGIGDVLQQTYIDVPVRRDTIFELMLTPNSGVPITRALLIEVSKEPPKIDFFTTSSNFLDSPIPVKLTWNVTGGERIEIDQGIGDVTGSSAVSVLPRSNTTYTLTATNFLGVSSTATIKIQVSSIPPSIHFFRTDRNHLDDGKPLELSWSVSDDADKVFINGIGSVARQGTMKVDQRVDTIYTLTATSYFGYSAVANVNVSVSKTPPRIEYFTSSPGLLGEGMEVELMWRVSGAAEVFVEPIFGAVPPEDKRTFQLLEQESCMLRTTSYYGAMATKEIHFSCVRPTKLTTNLTELTNQLTNLTTNLTNLYRRPHHF